jgi:hypothetical protein
MKLTRVKEAIAYRNRTGHKLPDDEVLQDLLFEAMLYVAQRCEPRELIAGELTQEPVYRNIEGGLYIKLPEYPDFTETDRHLMMDEDLTYAVINYVMYLITNTADFKILADETIAIYRSNFGRETFD